MTITNNIHPGTAWGKSSVPKHSRPYLESLPYDTFREVLVCGHSPNYIIRLYENQPWFCGLCFFREGVEAEVPNRIHAYKQTAENGNPETAPKFMAHLHTVMGLTPPQNGESLQEYRKRRIALAREQYTVRHPDDHSRIIDLGKVVPFSKPSPKLFPVTSALWRLMGFQPPLGIVLVEGVNGRTEAEIARKLSTSTLDIYIRMAKAIRTGMGFIPDDSGERQATGDTSGGRGSGGSEEA